MATFGQCFFLIVRTILVTTFSAKTQARLSCDRGWVTAPNGVDCFKLFDNPTKSWYDARRACKSNGGDLVTIRDKDRSNFIKEQFVYNNTSSMWIGLRKLRRSEKWRWLDEDLKSHGSYSKGCSCSSAFPCQPGWVKTPWSQLCVRLFDPEAWRLSWSKARRWCQRLGGDLVAIRNDAMSKFIRDQIVANNNFPAWIGFHKSTGEDRWHWLDEDGTRGPIYTNWGDGYPDRTKAKCAGIKKIDRQRTPWHTFNCSLRLRPICETAQYPHCYYKGTIYRHGSWVILNDKCGNPHSCIMGGWKPTTNQCRSDDGSCFEINEKRDNWICRKDQHGEAKWFWHIVFIDSAYGCIYKHEVFKNSTVLTFPDACGNPHTCINGRWVPAIYQCRWKESCLNLMEKRAGKFCTIRHGKTTLISE
ncbi:macrophage mannose receptor 1 [Plakobranchus ocellatus]|uniref:Macrophage mannose receptor 1 n=1 Tax=Plakobranchus ocellatus TaxID=259542 RepID=A0AAV4DNN5_9GAST|nr:macrophage mannose receptor 1 [Plakobranchus ocellatus]